MEKIQFVQLIKFKYAMFENSWFNEVSERLIATYEDSGDT